MPPRVTLTKWVNVGLTKELEVSLGKYIRENKSEVGSENEAIRKLLGAALANDTTQHNIVLSNLLKEALTLSTREEVLDWERRMRENVI